MVFRAVDAQYHRLLEDPSGDVPDELRIAGWDTIGERLPCVLVAEKLDTSRKDDTRVLGRLEACDEAELAAGPEALAVLLCGVNDGACIRVVSGIGCEARCRCAEDRDEVGAVSERVWGAGEPNGGDAWAEDGRLGDLHGDDRRGFIALGVV